MTKNWIIASYKINAAKRVEINLLNQKFEYYLPKIISKNINSSPKLEALFPGYIFVNTNYENYSALKYTMAIKSIVKFGENIAYLSNEDIKAMEMVEQASKLDPVASQIKIGQEATIKEGCFKGSMVKICSLPAKDRVDVLFTFLGSMRRVNILKKDLIF